MGHGTAVLKAAAAEMARRLVPTAVGFVVLTIAATTAVVGLTLAATPTWRSMRCPPATTARISR